MSGVGKKRARKLAQTTAALKAGAEARRSQRLRRAESMMDQIAVSLPEQERERARAAGFNTGYKAAKAAEFFLIIAVAVLLAMLPLAVFIGTLL